LKAEALETAVGVVPLVVGTVLAIVTAGATAPMGTGPSFLLALIVSVSVLSAGLLIMRAAYLPVIARLRADADQEAMRR
jgi:Flp pilus assembly protein TadB